MKKKLMNNKKITSFEGYIFNKTIFRSCFFILISFFLIIIVVNGGFKNNFYFSCNGVPCNNPFYCSPFDVTCINSLEKISVPVGFPVDVEVLNKDFVYGVKPPFYYNYFSLLIFVVLLFGFLINHFKHNKNFNFKEHYKKISDE